jgi:uncharacterized membrane protein YfcA
METSLEIALYLASTFAAALVAGLAGFAFGLVAAAAWLHILSPLETATLVIGYGLLVQGFAVWKLRHALDWRRLSPFLVGGALGVPIGVFVLRWADPASMRVAVGVLLIAYSVYAFVRPELKPARAAGALTDGSIGILNGVLGGMTGLAGIVVTVWCGVRGWPKDVQRAVFQPVAVAVFAMSAAWLGASRTISPDAIKLFVIGLPPLLLGTWAGLKLYGHLDETQFRRLILVLLLVSGAASMLPR